MADEKVLSELQTMNSLLRALLSLNMETIELKQADKVWLLYNSGLAVRDIATILRINANNVAVVLHTLRKSKGTNSGSKEKKKKKN
jgi:transposase-like protein